MTGMGGLPMGPGVLFHGHPQGEPDRFVFSLGHEHQVYRVEYQRGAFQSIERVYGAIASSSFDGLDRGEETERLFRSRVEHRLDRYQKWLQSHPAEEVRLTTHQRFPFRVIHQNETYWVRNCEGYLFAVVGQEPHPESRENGDPFDAASHREIKRLIVKYLVSYAKFTHTLKPK